MNSGLWGSLTCEYTDSVGHGEPDNLIVVVIGYQIPGDAESHCVRHMASILLTLFECYCLVPGVLVGDFIHTICPAGVRLDDTYTKIDKEKRYSQSCLMSDFKKVRKSHPVSIVFKPAYTALSGSIGRVCLENGR